MFLSSSSSSSLAGRNRPPEEAEPPKHRKVHRHHPDGGAPSHRTGVSQPSHTSGLYLVPTRFSARFAPLQSRLHHDQHRRCPGRLAIFHTSNGSDHCKDYTNNYFQGSASSVQISTWARVRDLNYRCMFSAVIVNRVWKLSYVRVGIVSTLQSDLVRPVRCVHVQRDNVYQVPFRYVHDLYLCPNSR